jgi:hypothetical protein
MRDPLQRLYETKLALLATIFVFLGAGMLVLAHLTGWGWLANVPVTDLGSALFTTGLVVVAFEYLDGKDSERRTNERLRRILREEAPAMRDAVIAGFALDDEDLKRVSSPEVLDQVTRNSLATQLGNREFAAEVYDDLKSQVIQAGERWENLRVAIDLSQWDRGTSSARTPMFVAMIRWEYSGIPTVNTRRFSCVSDEEEFRELLQEPASSSVWRFTPVPGTTADSPEAFELVQFSVNGQDRPIRRSAREGSQTYSTSIGKATIEAGQPVTVSYTYKVLVRQVGRRLHLSLSQPTRNLHVELHYDRADIASLDVLDFMGGPHRTRVSRAPADLPGAVVSVDRSGWALPGAGIAFIWEQ